MNVTESNFYIYLDLVGVLDFHEKRDFCIFLCRWRQQVDIYAAANVFSSPTSSQPPPVNTQNMKDVRDDVGESDDDEDDVKDEDGEKIFVPLFPQSRKV